MVQLMGKIRTGHLTVNSDSLNETQKHCTSGEFSIEFTSTAPAHFLNIGNSHWASLCESFL